MLLRGDARQWLEPVRVVRRAVLDGPVLERGGDDVRCRGVERLTDRDRAAECFVDLLRQPCLLHVVVERETPKCIGGARQFAGGLTGGDAPVSDSLDGVFEVQIPSVWPSFLSRIEARTLYPEAGADEARDGWGIMHKISSALQ